MDRRDMLDAPAMVDRVGDVAMLPAFWAFVVIIWNPSAGDDIAVGRFEMLLAKLE